MASQPSSALKESDLHANDDASAYSSGYRRRVTQERASFGVLGERLAERWLQRAGWRVIQRRFRSGRRDIDLIVERSGLVAFVEVKARHGADFGDPVEAVNWRKKRELSRSAIAWIERHGRPGETYRFDVVGVLVTGSHVRVRHVTDAFHLAAKPL